MKTSELLPLLAPFSRILNKNSLTPVYRTLQLDKGLIRGCAGWAMLEAAVDLGIQAPILVDAHSFLAVMSSLPADEVKLEVSDKTLTWSCGTAKGKLALILENIEIPKISRRSKPGAWPVAAGFDMALDLGGISCGASSLATAGLFGIALDNRNELTVRSSDDVTIAGCELSYAIEGCPDMMTLAPDGARLLASLCRKGGSLEFDDKMIYYRGDSFKAIINQVPPLKHDLSKVAEAFEFGEVTAPLPRDRVESFVKRASALAEDSKRTYVVLGASEGQLTLSFAEGAAATEEYYLVEGLEIPDMQEITVDALRMARVLEHSDEVVLDHIGRSVLVFRGSSKGGKFRYIIQGKK